MYIRACIIYCNHQTEHNMNSILCIERKGWKRKGPSWLAGIDCTSLHFPDCCGLLIPANLGISEPLLVAATLASQNARPLARKGSWNDCRTWLDVHKLWIGMTTSDLNFPPSASSVCSFWTLERNKVLGKQKGHSKKKHGTPMRIMEKRKMPSALTE